jgi:hypothetical protein
MDLFLWVHFKALLTNHHLIVQMILLPVSLRQQQPGIFKHTFQSMMRRRLMCVEEGARTFEHIVPTGNKLRLFFGILQWFFLISKLNRTHFNGPWHRKNTGPTYSYLIVKLFFWSLLSLHKVWAWSFLHPVYLKLYISYFTHTRLCIQT